MRRQPRHHPVAHHLGDDRCGGNRGDRCASPLMIASTVQGSARRIVAVDQRHVGRCRAKPPAPAHMASSDAWRMLMRVDRPRWEIDAMPDMGGGQDLVEQLFAPCGDRAFELARPAGHALRGRAPRPPRRPARPAARARPRRGRRRRSKPARFKARSRLRPISGGGGRRIGSDMGPLDRRTSSAPVRIV